MLIVAKILIVYLNYSLFYLNTFITYNYYTCKSSSNVTSHLGSIARARQYIR